MEVAALVILLAVIVALLWTGYKRDVAHARAIERLVNRVIAEPREVAVIERQGKPIVEPSPPNGREPTLPSDI